MTPRRAPRSFAAAISCPGARVLATARDAPAVPGSSARLSRTRPRCARPRSGSGRRDGPLHLSCVRMKRAVRCSPHGSVYRRRSCRDPVRVLRGTTRAPARTLLSGGPRRRNPMWRRSRRNSHVRRGNGRQGMSRAGGRLREWPTRLPPQGARVRGVAKAASAGQQVRPRPGNHPLRNRSRWPRDPVPAPRASGLVVARIRRVHRRDSGCGCSRLDPRGRAFVGFSVRLRLDPSPRVRAGPAPSSSSRAW